MLWIWHHPIVFLLFWLQLNRQREVQDSLHNEIRQQVKLSQAQDDTIALLKQVSSTLKIMSKSTDYLPQL